MQTINKLEIVSYTARAQRVFGNAQREAVQQGQRYMGPEQLLLGLLHEPDNMACQALQRLSVSVEDLRCHTRERIPSIEIELETAREGSTPDMAEVCLTPRAHRVLALAHDEARRLRHNSVGTEHLLLGIVRERHGLPGRLLAREGIDLDRAQKAVIALTGGRPADLASGAPGSVEPIALPGLLAALKHDGRSGKPILGLEWLVAYFFASLFLIIFLIRAAPWDDDWTSLLYIVFCCGVLRTLYRAVNRLVVSPQQRLAAQRLAQLQDKRVVGHLVDFITWPDESVRGAAKRALLRMLPHLRSGDAALLNLQQQGALRAFLHRRHVETDTELQIATLRAYEQIGDAQALPAVSALAAMRPRTENRRRVRAAAEECLPYLQHRHRQQQSSQTLLRPTQQRGAEAPREILLRPVAQNSATSPDELLRPDTHERAKDSKLFTER